MKTPTKKAKIISFVSYKGGVGRSLTLANMAYAFAKEGKRVGCIDLDLDAPGLTIIFEVSYTPPEALTMASMLATSRIKSIEQAIIDIPVKGNGAISLLPATYQPKIVEAIDWTHGAPVFVMKEMCTQFAELKNLDLILLDARAGAGHASGLAFAAANLVVCVLRIDRQCIEGTKKMNKVLEKEGGKSVLYLPSMVPQVKKAKTILKELRLTLPLETAIPYSSTMAIEEKVIMRDSPRTKTAKAYENLAKRILNSL